MPSSVALACAAASVVIRLGGGGGALAQIPQEPKPVSEPIPLTTPAPAPQPATGTAVPAAGAPGAAPQQEAPAAPAPPPAPTRPPGPLEPIADPTRPAPPDVPFVNPLFVPVDVPAKLTARPPLADWESREPLFVAVKVDETGRVLEAQAVEPPLRAFGPTVSLLAAKWTFKPARKDGQPVRTWATYGIDLTIQLEDAAWTSFDLTPVGKTDPLPEIGPETVGEAWVTRYPKEITPPEPGYVSVEDVDFLPMPAKSSWKAESTKLRSKIHALVEVSTQGQVKRIVPIGKENESLILKWVRGAALGWRFSPGSVAGKAVDSWLVLDATLEYALDSAKEVGKRSIKKNLRGTPEG